MSDHTGIEWTEATWNPIVGCTAVSPGCDHCYAARDASGRLRGQPLYAGLARDGVFTGEVRLVPERLDQPLRWHRPRRIFVNSMSDLFHDSVPDEFIAQVFAVMALTRRHSYQLLTKRHGRMRALIGRESFHREVAEEATEIIGRTYLRRQIDLGGLSLAGDSGRGGGWTVERLSDGGGNLWLPPWPLPNVWVGVSVETQQWADIRVPALLATPAAVRWISAEPLLGPVKLPFFDETRRCNCAGSSGPYYGHEPYCGLEPGPAWGALHWVVAGGESGPAARPMHPDWARSLRDQCAAAGVPFLFKQWGEHVSATIEDDVRFAGGRAFHHPRGGRSAVVIRERGPGRTFRSGLTRPMRPGDRTEGGLVMLDDDTVAVRVGKKAAGRLLDDVLHDEYPAAVKTP